MSNDPEWGFPANLTINELIEHYPVRVVHELEGPVVHATAQTQRRHAS